MANTRSVFFGTYPKYLDTDKKKLEYLKEKVIGKEITLTLYVELSDVLDVKDADRWNFKIGGN